MATYTDQIFDLTAPYDNQYQGPAERVLFVCSAGMLRSPTGALVATRLGFNARSCGSANYALIPISVNLIHWAHRIYFVNEQNKYESLEKFFGDRETCSMIERKSVTLDIEDNHDYMAPALVEEFIKILT